MIATETHSLSPKWIVGRKVSPYFRPFFQPKTLDLGSNLGLRVAWRRGLVFRGGKWVRKINHKPRKDHFITARHTSVSDADVSEWMVDMLWDIFEEADENGTVTLTVEQRYDIKEMLKMVDILDEGCGVCKGRGWGTKQDIRNGENYGWIVQKCPSCGGHGKLMYKRDVHQPALPELESEEQ